MNTLEISARSVQKETTEKRMKAGVYLLLAGIVLSAVLYSFFLVKTVVNVTYRQNTQRALSELRTQVGEMETERVALKKAVTKELAVNLGFVEVVNPEYLAMASRVSLNSR